MQRGNYATNSWSGKPEQGPGRKRSSTGSPPFRNSEVSSQRIARRPDAKDGAIQRALVAREEARARALTNQLRHRIFSILSVREACPKELSEELGEKFDTVNYHFRWLSGRVRANSIPLIEIVGTDRKHGGEQRFWRAIEQPRVTIEAAETLSLEEREESTAAVVPWIVADIEESCKAKTMDAHPLRSLLRMHIELDEEGMRKAADLAEAHLDALKDIAYESQERILAGSRGFPVATETLIFPVPKLYWTGA